MKCKNQDHLGKCFWEHGSLRWFISFTKVNPGHWQYCGCDAHEYGARWIPLAPWRQEVGSRVGEAVTGGNPISKGPDKSESHEEIRKLRCYHWCYLYCLVDNLFEHLIYHFSAVSCHIKPFEYNIIPLKKLKKKNISRSPIHQWFCCTWEWESDISIATLDSQQETWKIHGWKLKITCLKREFHLTKFPFLWVQNVNFQGCFINRLAVSSNSDPENVPQWNSCCQGISATWESGQLSVSSAALVCAPVVRKVVCLWTWIEFLAAVFHWI